MSNDDFDWNDADDNGDVVVQHQQQIAVYLNGSGDVVVRQDKDWYREADAWIVIRPENVRKLVAAMLALVEPEKPLALPAPAHRTAERPRSHREPELFEVHPPD